MNPGFPGDFSDEPDDVQIKRLMFSSWAPLASMPITGAP
jgi:hypothetical protein